MDIELSITEEESSVEESLNLDSYKLCKNCYARKDDFYELLYFV